jgi:hypothetical protein
MAEAMEFQEGAKLLERHNGRLGPVRSPRAGISPQQQRINVCIADSVLRVIGSLSDSRIFNLFAEIGWLFLAGTSFIHEHLCTFLGPIKV